MQYDHDGCTDEQIKEQREKVEALRSEIQAVREAVSYTHLTIEFKFPKRGDMPPVVITWYDGVDNIPPVPEGYGKMELDPNIPAVAGGKIQPARLNPGKEIYSKELTFKGCLLYTSHLKSIL